MNPVTNGPDNRSFKETEPVPRFTLDDPPWEMVGWLEAAMRFALEDLAAGDLDRCRQTLSRALADMPPKGVPERSVTP